MTIKWLIVGANGMLGQDFQDQLAGEPLVSLSKSECDVTNYDSVRSAIKDVDVVVNCAAYTAVDKAETEFELATAVNGEGPKNLAQVCADIGAKLIQISTDYVFSGDSKTPYLPESLCQPKSKYGQSKLLGEQNVKKYLPTNHYIVRTAWLYGKNGPNFGKTILHLAKSNENLNVVNDQIGQPTWTKDLVEKIIELVNFNVPSGTYHGTSGGQVSWFGYAQKLFELSGLDKNRLKPALTQDFPRPAPRPGFSVLDHQMLNDVGIKPIRNWDLALEEAYSAGVFDD